MQCNDKLRVMAPDVVHCRYFDLDVSAPVRRALAETLSSDERERAARFTGAEVRRRWVTSRGRLRQILAEFVGRAPGDLTFAYSGPGKPSLVDPDGGWQFNLSHSAHGGLVAVTRAGPVGVDIEAMRPLPDRDRLVARFFSAREQADYARIRAAGNEHEAETAFFRCWTRKEAVLKGLGTGVFGGLDRFSVSLGREVAPPDFHAQDSNTARWRLYDVTVPAGFAAAVAVDVAAPIRLETAQMQT